MTTHNLPKQPYERFFGRSDLVTAIDETLLQGGTFIASIDGVGGIGKTALAYHFCQEKIVNNPESRFEYLIWISSKTTCFNPFENTTNPLENNFGGIATLFDTILSVSNLGEYLRSAEDWQEKRNECEYILREVPVFLVLDNLENVKDEEFLSYIQQDFNRFAACNRDLKVLTTSRRRRQIIDHPIEIRGLEIEDALSMLNFYAEEFDLADIKNKTEYENKLLVEKVDKIPLGIEFITNQMKRGKTRGDIFKELAGYPALDKQDRSEAGDRERDATLSKIIQFMFQDMYENLDEMHQKIFVTVAILQRNGTTNISLEVLLMITSFMRDELEKILDTLIENHLLNRGIGNTYQISQMAINFAMQNYSIFGENEEDIVGKFENLKSHGLRDPQQEQVELYIKTTQTHLEKNDYDTAKNNLERGIEAYPGQYRLPYELGKIYKMEGRYEEARNYFDNAIAIASSDVSVWSDYINMMDTLGNHNVALAKAGEALRNTSQNVSILILMLNIKTFLVRNRDQNIAGFNEIRGLVNNHLAIYRNQERKYEVLHLLYWQEDLERTLVRRETCCEYVSVVDNLIIEEAEEDKLIEILEEAKKVLHDNNCLQAANRFGRKAEEIKEYRIYTLSERVKYMNRLCNKKDYNAAKSQAEIVLSLANQAPNDNSDKIVSALRILLDCYNREEDYQGAITLFDKYENFGSTDNSCKEKYDKAKRSQAYESKNEMIRSIFTYLQEVELGMRNMVMLSSENNEQHLLELLQDEGREDWYSEWNEEIRETAIPRGLSTISYSSFTQLVTVFRSRSCRQRLKGRIPRDERRRYFDTVYDRISATFTIVDITQERNEAYHIRLLEREEEDLRRIDVFINALTQDISRLEELVTG